MLGEAVQIAASKGKRWMLKFQVSFLGISIPENFTTKVVLKTVSYYDLKQISSRGNPRSSSYMVEPPDVTPIELVPTNSEPQIHDIARKPMVSTPLALAAMSVVERELVVSFNANGYFGEADLQMPTEEGHQKHSDIRFRAVLNSTSGDVSSEPLFQEQQEGERLEWEKKNRENIVLATADFGTTGDLGDLAQVITGAHIQPIFFLEQLEGFLFVAELIEKGHPTFHRLLVSIYSHSSNAGGSILPGRQLYIISPIYDVTNEEDLYTVGFHQDTDGEKTQLEFFLGRDDNFDQFATHELADADSFYFKTAANAGKSKVGIGCWPSGPDGRNTICFSGNIKEIICDPWGACTAC